MIRKLTLKNFQAWPSVELPLSPITVVIGETNAGKSSLLRGLACVLFNAFEGQGMVRQGESTAEVSIELDDDTEITWARGNGVNRYTIDDQVFDKPGRAVPQPVQDALQIHELEFDGETVRMQWAPQMDAPFLLADSGAKATRMLGVAGNAAVLAQATRLAQQETKSQQDALKAATTQLERLTAQLDGYADVEMAAPIAAALQATIARQAEVRDRRRVLRELYDQHVAAAPKKLGLSRSLEAATALADRLGRLVAVLDRSETLTSGSGLWLQKAALNARLGVAERLLDSWQQRVRLEEIRSLLRDAGNVCAQVQELRQKCAVAEQQFQQCQAEHDDLTSRLTCPTCGRLKEVA